MSIYSDLAAVARDVLGDFNQAGITYIRVTHESGATPDRAQSKETSYPINAGVARGVDEKYVNGTDILASDGQITMAAGLVSGELSARDFVIVGGKRHKVEKVINTPATGTVVTHHVIYKR